jgi:ribosomal-protein-alanine N-acetyltransferase
MSLTPPKIEIRALTAADADALAALFISNDVLEVTRHFHPFPLTLESARILCIRGNGRDIYRAGFYDARIAGIYMLRGWDEGFVVPSFGILIDRQLHRRGLGRVMTSDAIDVARRHAAPRLRLTVNASNLNAHKLYLSLGFVETEQHISSGERVLVMHRDL